MNELLDNMIGDVRRLAEIESLSDDLEALRRCADELDALAAERTSCEVWRDEIAGRPIVRFGSATAPG